MSFSRLPSRRPARAPSAAAAALTAVQEGVVVAKVCTCHFCSPSSSSSLNTKTTTTPPMEHRFRTPYLPPPPPPLRSFPVRSLARSLPRPPDRPLARSSAAARRSFAARPFSARSEARQTSGEQEVRGKGGKRTTWEGRKEEGARLYCRKTKKENRKRRRSAAEEGNENFCVTEEH